MTTKNANGRRKSVWLDTYTKSCKIEMGGTPFRRYTGITQKNS